MASAIVTRTVLPTVLGFALSTLFLGTGPREQRGGVQPVPVADDAEKALSLDVLREVLQELRPVPSSKGPYSGPRTRESLFRPGVFYREGIFDDADFAKMRHEVLSVADRATVRGINDLRRNLALPANSSVSKMISGSAMRKVIRELCGDHELKFPDFPVEVRVYDANVGFRWHRDYLMYRNRQHELVFTIENDARVETEYIDRDGVSHTLATKPNSLLVVRAQGIMHKVHDVPPGRRRIMLKAIYSRDLQSVPNGGK